jgi:hypothetical protein
MDKCAEELYDLARTKPNFDANAIELVVQVVPNQADSCHYYFVDHATRTLFWLHDHDGAAENILDGIHGVCDPSHIRTSWHLMAFMAQTNQQDTPWSLNTGLLVVIVSLAYFYLDRFQFEF